MGRILHLGPEGTPRTGKVVKEIFQMADRAARNNQLKLVYEATAESSLRFFLEEYACLVLLAAGHNYKLTGNRTSRKRMLRVWDRSVALEKKGSVWRSPSGLIELEEGGE